MTTKQLVNNIKHSTPKPGIHSNEIRLLIDGVKSGELEHLVSIDLNYKSNKGTIVVFRYGHNKSGIKINHKYFIISDARAGYEVDIYEPVEKDKKS